MTIAIFGNTLRSQTIREVKHIIEFLQLRGVNIVLSHELRQEARILLMVFEGAIW